MNRAAVIVRDQQGTVVGWLDVDRPPPLALRLIVEPPGHKIDLWPWPCAFYEGVLEFKNRGHPDHRSKAHRIRNRGLALSVALESLKELKAWYPVFVHSDNLTVEDRGARYQLGHGLRYGRKFLF